MFWGVFFIIEDRIEAGGFDLFTKVAEYNFAEQVLS